VLAQTTVPSSSVPANGENNPSYVSVSFTPRPPSVSGTQYAIVLGAPSASGCAYVWWGTSGNPYAGGQVEHSTNGGSSWTAASAFDFDFRTFVVQKAPGATTRGASNVSRNGATLHGTVNPQGQPTSFHFEFGTSKSYGKQTPSKGAGSDSSNHSVAQAIKGLKPNTVYHYRIVATNASGTTRGQDRTFRTRAASTPSPGPGPTCGGSANAGVNQQQRNPGTGNQGALGQQNAC
jgi:hypothetical protein